jgi:cellulose biosynthesis protein BcsQ
VTATPPAEPTRLETDPNEFIGDEPLMITVGGLKGGIGKSTSSVFLATAIARRRLRKALLAALHDDQKSLDEFLQMPLARLLARTEPAVLERASAALKPLLVDADPQSQTSYDWAQIALSRKYELPWQCLPWATDDLPAKIRGMKDLASDVVADVGGETSKMFRAAVSVCPELIIPVRPNLIELRRIPATIEAAREVENLTGTKVYPRVLLVSVDTRAGDGDVAREFLANNNVPVMKAHVRQGVLYPRTFGHVPDELGDYDAVLNEINEEVAA